MSGVDPITFAVVRQKLVSIANGMQETGTRMGFTTFMYEVHDCLFAILDANADSDQANQPAYNCPFGAIQVLPPGKLRLHRRRFLFRMSVASL